MTVCPEFFEKFDSLEALEKRQKELYESDKIIIGHKECKGFKPSTKYKVEDNSGNYVEFKEFDTNRSEYLQKIADSTKKFYLYYELI